MKTSKLFVSVSAILFLLTTSLSAQSDSVGYKSQLQFHLVNGYSLSYLNSLSNSSALRYKLDFNLSVGKMNNDGSSSSTTSSNVIYTTSKNESNSQGLNFTTQYLWYPVNESLVRIFLGAGPFISFDRFFTSSSINNTWNNNPKSYSSNETLQYSLGIGISGAAGVECFVTKQLSLIGEYGISGSYSWGKQKYLSKSNSSPNQPVSENTNESNTNGWNIGLGNFRFGIAFRF